MAIRRVSASFTRPADTTAYAAGDAVSNSTSAPTILGFAQTNSAVGRGGYIIGARLMTSQKANVAQYRLHLYHTTITALNDNAVCTLLYANNSKRVGQIDLGPLGTEDTTSTAAEGSDFTIRIPYQLDVTDSGLYGLLETKTVFTPDSAQTYYIELLVDQV